jgi:hypothetical protein
MREQEISIAVVEIRGILKLMFKNLDRARLSRPDARDLS